MKKNVKKKKKGFTLIELLAVIIILGILMVIAVPAITKYINESRKNSYISTAKNIMNGAIPLANSETLDMIDNNTTYYVPASYIKADNNFKSPYGNFTAAYVGVIHTENEYKYYWISTDSTETGIKYITPYDELDVDDLKNNITSSSITNTVEKTGIENRSTIKILNPNTGEWETHNAEYNYMENGVTFASGKNKTNATVGDLVKIEDEEFYVIKNDINNNELVLLAHYNLKVGKVYSFNPFTLVKEFKESEEGYGMQSSEMIGYDGVGTAYGVLPFCNSGGYWDGEVGENLKYPGNYSRPNNPYVYDNNSTLYPYLQSYAKKLKVRIKEIRIISLQELIELGCDQSTLSCENAVAFLKQSGIFWTGSAYSNTSLYYYSRNTDSIGPITCLNYVSYGIRPIIII